MKNQETKLRAEFNRIRSKLLDMEDRRTLKEGRKLIGKCFKVKNGYGHGDDWWLYKRVIDARKTSHSFQITSGGEFIYRKDGGYLGQDYVEIPRTEFDAAWKNFLGELENAGK